MLFKFKVLVECNLSRLSIAGSKTELNAILVVAWVSARFKVGPYSIRTAVLSFFFSAGSFFLQLNFK